MKALLAVLLLAVPAFAGPPTIFPESISGTNPPPSVVRVYAFDEEDSTRNSGTGTLIRNDIVVTASHIVEGKEGARVEILFFTDWSVVLGKVIAVSPNNDTDGRDVAIIKLDNPRSETPMPLATKAALGSVQVMGFSHGPFTRQDGVYYTVDTTKRWGMIRNAQARNGDSGGPVVQNGKLVGVLWGSAEKTTWFTAVEFLYELYPDLKKTEETREVQDAPVKPFEYIIR